MLDTVLHWIGFGLIPFMIGLPIMGIIAKPKWRQVPAVLGANLLVTAIAVFTGWMLIGAIIGGAVAGFILRPVFHKP